MSASQLSRRRFLEQTTASAGASLLINTSGLAGADPAGQTAAEKAARARMKVGLYSITYLGLWYRGESLTLEDVIERARKYGYDGVEIDGKRPHGNPLDMPKGRCQELRSRAESAGLELYSVAANNDLSSPVPEVRESQIVYLRELIRMAAELRVKTVRVFLAWPGVTQHPQLARYDLARGFWKTIHESFSPEETWEWCRAGLAECAGYAGDAGVTLALQNHAPVINDHQDVLRMVRQVNSPHLKVSLDVPIMPDKSPAAIQEAARAVGPLQVLSHFGGEYQRQADGSIKGEAFYPMFVKAMKDIGYEGYIGFELCHPLPVVNGQTVGIEFVDENAELAAEYMRGLIRAS
jgi:sugar phosphate isomerase/epimerase